MKGLILLGIVLVLHGLLENYGNCTTKKESYDSASLENGVSIVKYENLEQLVNTNRILLIMCYVPWNKRYQEKIAFYEKVATAALQSTDTTLGKMDIAGEPLAAEALEIYGSELQFILFYKAKAYNVKEFVDDKSLVKWLSRISEPTWSPPQIPHLVNPVKEISKNEFQPIIKAEDFTVVLFYLPQSQAGQRLLYDFELAVHTLKPGKRQGFYKFDATDKPESLEKYAVGSLPAFKIFRRGKVYDYNGPVIGTNEILKYIREHTQKPFTELADPQELEWFLKNHTNRATVVGFFASKALAKFAYFIDAAQTFRDNHYFVCMSTPMVKNVDGGEPQLVPGWTLAVFLPKKQHTPDDEKRAVLQYEEASYEMVVDFIKWKTTPLAGARTVENMKTTYSLRPLVVVYSKIDWSKTGRKTTEYIRDKVASAAKDHKDTLFAVSDTTLFKHEVERFGFDMDEKYELHVGIIGKDGEYYPRWDTTHMNSKMIGEFVKQFKDGEVKPYFRSTSKPSRDPSGVKELNGLEFQTQVLEADSHACVLFYHPLAQSWRLIDSFLKDLERLKKYEKRNVLFAKLDASVNDVPAYFNLTTYPILYFVHKHDKTHPVLYKEKILDVLYLGSLLEKFVDTNLKITEPRKPVFSLEKDEL